MKRRGLRIAVAPNNKEWQVYDPKTGKILHTGGLIACMEWRKNNG